MIFFSIIIPTFNSAGTIEICLNSIIKQTYTNFEVIIIDGLSKDRTSNIVSSFRDNRIKCYSEKDRGIYDAMNKGIKLVKGKWLLFLGSDDSLYSKDTLLEIKKELQGYDVVYGNVFSTRFNGIYDGEFTEDKILQKNICHQSIFFNRTVFNKTGLFNLKYKSHADWEHNFKWFLSNKIKKKYIPVIVSNYADGGFSSTNTEVFFNDVKYWKYCVLTKAKINLRDKINIIRLEYKKAKYQKRRRDALIILLQTPYFLF